MLLIFQGAQKAVLILVYQYRFRILYFLWAGLFRRPDCFGGGRLFLLFCQRIGDLLDRLHSLPQKTVVVKAALFSGLGKAL